MSLIWLMEWCLKATLVLLVCGAATACVRSRPSLRRLIWAVGFVTIIGLPLPGLLAPADPVLVTVPISAIPSQTASSGIFLFGVWLGGAVVVSANYVVGLIGLARLRARSLMVSREGRCEIRVNTSASPGVALTWGLVRPVILLPQRADQWNPASRRAVVLHELAHVRNGDAVFQFVTRVVCAALWFNPIVWLAASAFRLDAEGAADEAVVRQGMRPTDYASLLLSALETKQSHPQAGLAFVRRPQIEQRIRWIVQRAALPASLTPRHTFLVAGIAVALFAALAASAIAGPKPEPETRSREWWEGFRMGQDFVRKRGRTAPRTQTKLARTLFLSEEDRRDLERHLATRMSSPSR